MEARARSLCHSMRLRRSGNYQDGSPKKWWVEARRRERRRDVQTKEIVVNDPLLYSGVRFYQSSYGPNGKGRQAGLIAAPNDGSGQKQEIGLALTSTGFARFRYYRALRRVLPRLRRARRAGVPEVELPGKSRAHLVVTSKKAGKDFDVWIPQMDEVCRQLQGALPVPGHRLEDGPLHRLAGVARAGAVGSLVRCGADGHRTGIRVLPLCTCDFGWYPFAIPKRASVRCGSGEPRTAIGRVRAALQRSGALVEKRPEGRSRERLQPAGGHGCRELNRLLEDGNGTSKSRAAAAGNLA